MSYKPTIEDLFGNGFLRDMMGAYFPFGDLELRYLGEQRFTIWENGTLSKEGVDITIPLNIESDSDLLTFLKIIGAKK